jgi:hypothetical protein
MRTALLLSFLIAGAVWAQEPASAPPSAEAIMARVAANQDRAESLRAVFFINRLITISLENTDFERTHVESRIKSAQPEEQ